MVPHFHEKRFPGICRDVITIVSIQNCEGFVLFINCFHQCYPDAIQKIEEQIGKSKIIYHDPMPTLLNKFQKELAKLRKDGKQLQKKFKYHMMSPICIHPYP